MKNSKKTAEEILTTLALLWAEQNKLEVKSIEVNKVSNDNGGNMPSAG